MFDVGWMLDIKKWNKSFMFKNQPVIHLALLCNYSVVYWLGQSPSQSLSYLVYGPVNFEHRNIIMAINLVSRGVEPTTFCLKREKNMYENNGSLGNSPLFRLQFSPPTKNSEFENFEVNSENRELGWSKHGSSWDSYLMSLQYANTFHVFEAEFTKI